MVCRSKRVHPQYLQRFGTCPSGHSVGILYTLFPSPLAPPVVLAGATRLYLIVLQAIWSAVGLVANALPTARVIMGLLAPSGVSESFTGLKITEGRGV